MTPLALVHDPCFKDHRTGPGHPESPDRLDAVAEALAAAGVLESALPIAPEPIDTGLLHLRHRPEYVRRFEQACREGAPLIDVPDCTISRESYRTALLAAGATVAATAAVVTGRARRAFCAVRPPGHHAESDRAMGFCMFNNIALAALAARLRYGVERVLIFDFDVHHGNGTQNAFYDDPAVCYISMHGHPHYLYPGTGLPEETGRGEAAGTTLNVPLLPGAGDEAYRAALTEQVLPAIRSFEPQLILLSAGFDAHRDDPLGNLALTDAMFVEVLECILEIARRCADGRVVSVLEGGYNLDVLRRCVAAHVELLAG